MNQESLSVDTNLKVTILLNEVSQMIIGHPVVESYSDYYGRAFDERILNLSSGKVTLQIKLTENKSCKD